jgi:hypothetical protein
MNSNNQSARQDCEMRFFREIEGKKKRHRIRNKIIGEAVRVQPIKEHVERSQLRW